MCRTLHISSVIEFNPNLNPGCIYFYFRDKEFDEITRVIQQ